MNWEPYAERRQTECMIAETPVGAYLAERDDLGDDYTVYLETEGRTGRKEIWSLGGLPSLGEAMAAAQAHYDNLVLPQTSNEGVQAALTAWVQAENDTTDQPRRD